MDRLIISIQNTLTLLKKYCIFAVIIFLNSFIFSFNLNAQTTSWEPYKEHDPNWEAGSERHERIVKKNIDRTYPLINDFVRRHGEKKAVQVSQQKNRKNRFNNPGPEEHPLDQMGGKLDQAKSWHEYKMDSLTILNAETFPVCLEPRLVAERGNDTLNALNPAIASRCATKCPPLLFYRQHWRVISYYWPQYQISINKAGAQMIDPAIVDPQEAGNKLYRIRTAQSEDNTDNRRHREKQLELLRQMGIPSSDFKNPEYHRAGQEFHLQQDGEVRYPRAMRPNAFWRAADARTMLPFGWVFNPACFYDALDPPTGKKKVVANSFDQGTYAVLARYPEVRKRTDGTRYRYTTPTASSLENYKHFTPPQFKQSLCASWRMQSNPQVYGALEKVGFSAQGGNRYKDFCLPGGLDLSGSMVHAESTPLLQADAARAAMAAIWFSSDSGQFRNFNQEDRRLPKFSLYENRDSRKRDRYVNLKTNPGENKSDIVFVDKIQRIYPTQPLGGNPDGKGGASSKGYRTVAGQRGSYCFRPEDIPNWSSEDSTTKEEWPLGLHLGTEDHYGETRWAIWNQRVMCACEIISFSGTGCSTVDDGDNDTEVFAGKLIAAGDLPKPLPEGIRGVKGFATREGAPSNRLAQGPDTEDLRHKIIDDIINQPGYTKPNVPLDPVTYPPVTGTSPPITLFLCIDQNNNQSITSCPNGQCSGNNNSSNPSGSNSTTSNPGTGNNTPQGNNTFGGFSNCPDGKCPFKKSFNAQIISTSGNKDTGNLTAVSIGNSFKCDIETCQKKAEDFVTSGKVEISQFKKNNNPDYVCNLKKSWSSEDYLSCSVVRAKASANNNADQTRSKSAPPVSNSSGGLFDLNNFPSDWSPNTNPGIGGNTPPAQCTGPGCGGGTGQGTNGQGANGQCTGPGCGGQGSGSGQQYCVPLCQNGSCSGGQQGGGNGSCASGNCGGGSSGGGAGCSGGNCGGGGAGGGCSGGGCGGGSGAGGGGSGGGGFGGIIGGIFSGIGGGFPTGGNGGGSGSNTNPPTPTPTPTPVSSASPTPVPTSSSVLLF